MKITFIVILLVAVIANLAFADIMAKDWDRFKNDKAIILYVNGVAKGLFWTNIIAGDKLNQKIKLLCLPENMTLNSDNVVSIIDSQITQLRKTKGSLDTPIEMLLIDGLMDAFPCK
jgi:hypothetical protein